MATASSAPPGMEWQSYFNNFSSLRDVIQGKSPSTAGVVLGHAINALAGGSTNIGDQMGGNQSIFGAPAAVPQGAVPSPSIAPEMTAPAAPMPPAVPGQQPQFVPQVNGQPMMTQPPIGTNIQQQPMTQPQSYSRFLFSPK